MTGFIQLPPDQLSSIRLEDVQLYLYSRGWKRDDDLSGSVSKVYRYPSIPDAEAVLPSRPELKDYEQRIADVIEIVAAVEERNAWQVLADFASPPADIVRLQVTAPEAPSGSVSLNAGIRLIEGARNLLLAAACSAHQAAAFYARQAYREAVDFLNECQLGQTERGSFIAKVIAPVPPQISRQKDMFEDDRAFIASEPFARKSTLHLMTALQHIRTSIDNGNYDAILEGIELGVSANLCDALAAIQPEGGQSDLRIRMTWSPTRPHLPRSIANTVGFSQAAFSIIREAGRKLREVPHASKQRIEGRIITLKADQTLLDDFEGTVLLKAYVGVDLMRVQVALNASDYKKACDAHRDGHPIAVTGVLQREPKMYRMLQPQEFNVIQNETIIVPTLSESVEVASMVFTDTEDSDRPLGHKSE